MISLSKPLVQNRPGFRVSQEGELTPFLGQADPETDSKMGFFKTRILRQIDPFLVIMPQVPGHTDPVMGRPHRTPNLGQFSPRSVFF